MLSHGSASASGVLLVSPHAHVTSTVKRTGSGSAEKALSRWGSLPGTTCLQNGAPRHNDY